MATVLPIYKAKNSYNIMYYEIIFRMICQDIIDCESGLPVYSESSPIEINDNVRGSWTMNGIE